MRRLPSLTGVEAFVATARNGSLKAAAEELSLSSPALSRRIQSFERHAGRPLFTRGHQSMKLNEDGERLMELIAPALDQLSDAMETMLSGDAGMMRLRLGVLPLFATQRLIGRLPSLRELHPGLHIDIDTAPHAAARLGDGLDAAIVLARDADPSLVATRLDHNVVLAIGARHWAEGPDALRDPNQLTGMTVIIHRDMPDTFEEWRRAVGLPHLEPAAIDHYDSGQLMLDAAAEGLGVAFLHRSHLTDAHDDRIARLFNVTVKSPYSYWFVCRPRAFRTRPVRLFHDWLVAAMKEYAADLD